MPLLEYAPPPTLVSIEWVDDRSDCSIAVGGDMPALLPSPEHDVIDERVEIEQRVGDFTAEELVSQALSYLPAREREVIVTRYGLLDGIPRTLETTGQCMDLTKQQVHAIEGHALEKLRIGATYLIKELG